MSLNNFIQNSHRLFLSTSVLSHLFYSSWHFSPPDILYDKILGSLNRICISYPPKRRKEMSGFQNVNFIADMITIGVRCSLLPCLRGQFGLGLLCRYTYGCFTGLCCTGRQTAHLHCGEGGRERHSNLNSFIIWEQGIVGYHLLKRCIFNFCLKCKFH